MALTKISTAMWNAVPHHLSHDFNVDDVLFVDVSENKVGIGTNSPIDQLHIKSTTTDARMVLDGHTGFDAELKFFEAGAAKYTVGYDAATANFVIGTTNVDTGQRLVIDSSGNVGVGSQNPVGKFEVNTGSSAAYFTRTAGDNGGTAPAFGILTDASLTRLYSWGTGMTFWTASVGGTTTERLRISSSGQTTAYNDFIVETSSPEIYLNTTSATHYRWMLAAQENVDGAFEITPTTTVGGSTYSTPVAVFKATGNVGIGTTSPSQKLTVEGNIELGTGGYIYGDTTNPRVYLNNANGAFLMYGGSSYIGVGSSNISASVNINAPAFYDSDNTGYYLNPAGTSNFGNNTIFNVGSKAVSDTSSLVRFNGNYTNGQYTHRFRKQDLGGGIPLFVDYAHSTANSYTALARFGYYTGNGYEFEVFGDSHSTASSRAPVFYDSNNTNFYGNFNAVGDSIRAAGDIVAYYSSDRRLKDNIIKINSALDKVNAIGGYTFEWNEISHKETGKKDVGVIAQEVEEIFPEIVQTRSNGYKAVNYEKLVPLLIEAVKELSEKVKVLEASK